MGDLFIDLLYVQSWGLGVWAVTLAVASNVGTFDSVRAIPTRVERTLARLPRLVPFAFGKSLPEARGRTGAFRQLDARVRHATRTVDSGLDAAFALPVLAGWLLLLTGLLLLATAGSLLGTDASLWLVPAFFLLLDFATLLVALALKQRTWDLRAPFEWRLYLSITVQRDILAQAVAKRRPPEVVEELALRGARQIEHVLRNRFARTAVAESDRAAALTWERLFEPLLESRARRLLSAGETSPSAWFASWTEDACRIVLAPYPTSDEKRDLLPPERPAHETALRVSLSLFTIAVLGVAATVFSPTVLTQIPWKDLLGVPAAALALITCLQFFSGTRRRKTDRA
ncbi:hypothetical protein [Frondihabitans australicus]|uniref:Uncharacterized protein n=1 Tax=Frondihabitans australicus TaxID=386892 RepID=A0A495IK11_9MICO|nr:hypothetical protein [Frondihabitans australicus]RKR76313.1 hypothetical protein C8E83_3482 [Frondihabitans australicus]